MLRPYSLLTLSSLVVTIVNADFAQAQRGRGPDAARYGWLSDYRAAKEQAKKTGKPIMLVFRCIP